jgi:hypothetical protein
MMHDPIDGAIREGDPPIGGGMPRANASPNANRLSRYFWLLLFLNIAAAYCPSLFWMNDLPGSGSAAEFFPYSPIAISLLFLIGFKSMVFPTVLLCGFLSLIVALSFLFQRSRIVIIAMPGALFLLCLVQGLVFAAALRGIDAIGHS